MGGGRVAALVAAALSRYEEEFAELTRGAAHRFSARDWAGAHRASVARLALYREVVTEALADVALTLGEAATDVDTWRTAKAAFAAEVEARPDRELAHTFFNSVARRVFHTVGVNPAVEFVELDAPPPVHDPGSGTTVGVPLLGQGLAGLVRNVLAPHRPSCGFLDLERDVAAAAAALGRRVEESDVLGAEMAVPVFYRNKGAYLVGRLLTRSGPIPLVLALLNPDTGPGAILDAVLVGEDEASIVFSFTRSYFLVDTDHPREMVGFLHALLPRKPLSELFNAVGLHRHGKTEFYRALLAHIARSDDRFEIAPGARGMVMVVFSLPSYDVVFKIIRDRFDPPKTATRREVMEKYALVSDHDRAGRLVDAQEFEHLAFDRSRFREDLIEELLAKVAGTVEVDGDQVVLHHVYTERKVEPLDLYLRRADPEAARAAILDYGVALRDLAATDIFPGDLLLKNFGVTRLGRVVFYDYDELGMVTEYNFRELPTPRDDEEETAGGAWFYVGDRDIFPEEFLPFLGLTPPLRDAFLGAHAEVLTPRFWLDLQARHRAGEVLDIFPYRAAQRLGGLPKS